MRSFVLILLLSVTYAGCSARARLRSTPAGESAARLRVGIAPAAPVSLRGSTGATLVRLDRAGGPRPGLATSWQVAPTRRAWTFLLTGEISSEEVAGRWDAAVRDPSSAAGWLLAPLAAANGIATPAADRLVLNLAREAPDLPERLSHPSLALPGGPYRVSAGGVLERAAAAPGARPFFDEVVIYRDDPSLLLRIGEADAAVVYGSDAESLLASLPAGLTAERAAGWDRTYALWLNAGSATLGEVGARERIVQALDREEASRQLFGRRAVAATSLLGVGAWPGVPRGLANAAPGRLPPRVALLFRRDDEPAEAIAARVRAELLSIGVEVAPEPADPDRYARRLREGDFEMAVVDHTPATADPLLALGLTLWRLRSVARDALSGIERATAERVPALREAEAVRVESTLIAERRLMPLVTLQAWLVRSARLTDLVALPWSRLTLEQARWRP